MKAIIKNEVGREKNPYFEIDTVPIANGYVEEKNPSWKKFEQSVIEYPAPGIEDGEFECELVWEESEEDANGNIIWKKCFTPLLATSDTRQIFKILPTIKGEKGEKGDGLEYLKMITSEKSDVHDCIHVNGRDELFISVRYAIRAVKLEKERQNALIDALEKIIEMNRQHAEDQYGNPDKAESWGCVKVARNALNPQ